MTRAWRFYIQVMATFKLYEEARIDLVEVARQIEESYLWVYGQRKTVKQLVGHYDRQDLQFFFWLAARNS